MKDDAKARQDIETCFAAGILVHTKNGLRPIEELQVGDLVLTWPEEELIPVRPYHPFRLNNEYIYKPVTKTFVHEDQIISHVVIRGNGNTANDDEILRITPNHSVWSKRNGWVQASTLKFGHTLKQADFSDNLIRGAKHGVERLTVFNIEVEDCHTYFVGEKGIWVHDKSRSTTPESVRRQSQF